MTWLILVGLAAVAALSILAGVLVVRASGTRRPEPVDVIRDGLERGRAKQRELGLDPPHPVPGRSRRRAGWR